MRGSNNQRGPWNVLLLALGMSAAIGLTGCQVDIGGQTHPSPYYLTDDVQYFAPGPEFKHAREAAAQREAAQEQALQR